MTGMEISWLPMRRFIHSYWNRRIFCFKIKYEEATINALHEYFGFSKSKLKKTIEDNPYSYYEVYKKNMTYDEVEKFQKFLDLADASAKGVSKAKKAKIESAKMVKEFLLRKIIREFIRIILLPAVFLGIHLQVMLVTGESNNIIIVS